MQESEVSRLEETVCYLKSQKYQEKCSEAAEHKYKKEVERLHGNVEELEQEREELEQEVAELRRAAQKRSTRRWEQGTERKHVQIPKPPSKSQLFDSFTILELQEAPKSSASLYFNYTFFHPDLSGTLLTATPTASLQSCSWRSPFSSRKMLQRRLSVQRRLS